VKLLGRLKEFVGIFRFSMDAVEYNLGRKLPKLNMTFSSLLLIMAISSYTLIFSYFTILRHYCFQSSGWDLGIYMQSLYTTSFQGKALGYTLEIFAENPSGAYLGVHFSPLLFLLVPLYRLAPFAETLLVLQSFVIAMGAFGLYMIAYHVLENRFVSLSLAISYLLYTPLQVLNWFDFHLQAFIPIFFFLMFFFYIKKDYLKSFAFFVLVLSTIEMMPVLIFAFGLYCVFSDHKERKALIYALIVIFVSLAWFLLASFVKASLNPMYSTTFGAWRMWGSNYLQLLTSVITKPVDVLLYFFTVSPLEKVLYFLWFMAPLFFLPILARKEFILLVMPWITFAFLSAYPGYFTNQYAAFVVPQVFIAAVYGLKQVSKSAGDGVFRKSLIMRYGKWVLLGTIITFILVSPFGLVPQAREIYIHGLPVDSPHKEALREALQLIPDNASVYTSFHIAPHLANRLELYSHAVPDKPTDYIVIDLKSRDSSISLGTFGGAPIVGMDQLLRKYNYSLVVSNDGILIYKIGIPLTSVLEPITMSFDYRDLEMDSGNVVVDSSSQSSLVLAHRPSDWSYGFWHGPYVALPQGRYEATYRLKSEEIPDGHLLTLDVTCESGQTLIARKYVYGHDLIPNAWNNIKLQFSVEQPTVSVELRGTYASNMTTQYLDFIELRQSSPVANITFGALSFNYKDLPVVHGKLMPGDLTIHEMNDSEPFSLGLYAKAPPGKYTARFWLKIDALSQGRVFSISIDDFNKTNLAQKEIFAEDFDQRESWQCFSLDFVMGNFTSIVEIRGIGSRESLTSFSYVELENQE
jgi:uncharacterized membrane protein